MKKFIFTISLLIFSISSIAQIDYTKGIWDVFEEDFSDYIPSTSVLDSRNGYQLPPYGQIRFLMVFVELEYSNSLYDPSFGGTPEWSVGQLPTWKDELLEYNTPNGLSDCTITKYFQLASSNNLIVLGDYLVAPNNGGVFRMPTDTSGSFNVYATIDTINHQLGNSFTTAHGFSSISDFDTWSTTNLGETKTNLGNNKWDFVVFIIRNSRNPGNGEGAGSVISLTLLGHGIDARAGICTKSQVPTQVIRHEYAHMLLGGNNFHSGGGGWGFGKGDYWIPQSGGWGLLGLYQCSLWTWSAWDRYRLGWMGINNQFEISARDQYGINEVNGDLDATNPNHAGIYTLRDFVTTGDAIRIKLPFVDEYTEYPEWIWIENHQGYDNNDCEFDRWQYDNGSHDCVNGMTAGMMLYTQINNEHRLANSSNNLFTKDFYANYTRPLLANGHWDMHIPTEYIHNNCVNYDTIRPFVRYLENPLTGANDQDYYSIDKNANSRIEKNDQLPLWIEKKSDGTYDKELFGLGHTSHVFTIQGNHKIGMGTNPTTATQINMVGEDQPYSSAKNLRNTYLNGVSIDMIEQCSNGDIRVKISFDDVDIDNDARWCSPNIKLNKIKEDGFSLNLKKNRTITLDRGLNATRMDMPYLFNGQYVFTSPTLFTVMPEVKMHIDTSASLILENSSTFFLREQSTCIVEDDGVIEIKDGGLLRIDDCGKLEINGRGLLIARSGAKLRISPQATLAFQNGLQNILLEENVHFQNSSMPLDTLINVINHTISNIQISGTETWNCWDKKVNGFITVQPGATLNIESSTLHFLNRNSGVIVQPGGKLIVDNSVLTNLSTNCGEMWHGIEVWGDTSVHQYPDLNSNYLQGYLKLKNGATIENAICAVDLWRPGNYGTTGGIVRADSAFFINNAKAIHALNYTNYYPTTGATAPYMATFNKCTFSINSQYHGTEAFYNHIDLANVSGLSFNGCSFSAIQNETENPYRYSAIAAYDAGFFVNSYCEHGNPTPCPEEYLTRSSFSGFHDAIHVTHAGGSTHSFVIKNALFSDNDIGIYANNTGHASIRNCSFAVGHENSCGFGVYVENVTSFSIEENSFAPYTGFSGESYGIVVVDCPAQNDIYLNSFDGLTCGNLASGWNLAKTHEFSPTIQGLTYSCNQDTHNTIDFCVLTNSGTGGINPYQGSSINPAGNTFGGSDFHFYNDGNDSIDYYYNPNSTGQTPSLSLMYNVNRISTNANSRCMSHNGGTQEKSQKGKTELEEDFLIASENFKQLVDLYKKLVESGNTEPELAELRAQIAQHANDRSRAASGIVRLILFDSIANPQELRTWLRNEGDLSSERFVIASFIQEGDFDNAMELAKNLPTKYGLEGDDLNDHMDYIRLLELYRTLHKEGRTKNQLTEDETVMVEEIASNTFGISRSLAKALLENQPIKRRTWFPCPELPRPESKERGSSSAEKHKASNFTIKVTPNPASTQAKVDYWLPKVSFNAKLSLVNVFGEQMIEFLLEGDRGSTVIDFGNLPEGVYLIIISDSNGNTFTEKVVKH